MTVVYGHYGVGKTNLSINLAIDCARSGEDVTLVDMDIVNPFFRSADYGTLLSAEGVRVIGPNFANTNLDTPSLPGSIRGAIEGDGMVIIDVGGDDAGATALAVYRRQLEEADPDVLYVINMYRSLTTCPDEAVTILREIEGTSGLRAKGIVNNSHLMGLTTPEHIEASRRFAEDVCDSVDLPLRFTTVPHGLSSLNNKVPLYPIEIFVRTPWEQER